MTGNQSPARCKIFKRILSVVILQAISCSFSLFAQADHYEKVFTVENGLPHNQVLSIVADKTGFLWIGTWDGVCRFDGYEFRNYHHDPNDSTTIPYFIGYKICVDRYNNVWIYHVSNMLSRYIRNTDTFRSYSYNADKTLSKIGIADIETDRFGNLFVSGPNGLAVYDSAMDAFKEITLLKKDRVFSDLRIAIAINFDNTDHIWLGGNDMFYKGHISYQQLTVSITDSIRFIVDGKNYSQPRNSIQEYDILSLSDNSDWMLSNRGLRNIQSGLFVPELPVDFPEVVDFLWFRIENRINIFSRFGKYVIEMSPDESPQTVFVDRSGTVWYSTVYNSGTGTGLHRYNKTPTYFTHYLPLINGMPSAVRAVAKDNRGNILVGLDFADYIICITEMGKTKKLNILNKQEASDYSHLRCFLPAENGIFAGYMKGRLDFYDYASSGFRNICVTNDPTWKDQPYGFRTLYKDKRGNIIIGSMGIYMLDPDESLKFHIIWQSDPPRQGFFSMNADSSGNIWAGSGSLLYKKTPEYKLDTVYTISNIIYNIEDITFDNNGNLWLALLGGGILKFNPESGIKKFFTTADGLSNNTTYSILPDKHNNLWITTDNGISRFNTRSEKFRVFGPTDGLMIHEFNSDASFLESDGRMYFGGMGGVVSFHPDSIDDPDEDNAPKPLIITEFRVSGAPRYFERPLYETGGVVLQKGDDNFGVTFACIDLKNSEKIKYRYRLSGLREEWTETDHLHRTINFTGLQPSTYYLEIQSSDIYGEWNKNLNLQIVFPPMFYQTRSFSILMVALALIVISLFLVLNNRQIRIKESQKQQYLKLESIRGQMNPHFIFNSLNSINYFIANNDRLAANRYIANFSKLIRSFLSNMSQEYVSLEDEIASLEDYLKLEYLRFSDKFEYVISLENLISPHKWEVFPGMVQPFVENAIWHGVRGLQDRKGNIQIIFNENSGIHCTIRDDGVGRQIAAKLKNFHEKRKSKGIGLIMERMQLINHLENKNYKITIEDLFCDRDECGTCIEIEIPSRIKVKNQIAK